MASVNHQACGVLDLASAGEGFEVDASLIQADDNKQRSIAGQDWRRDRDPARSSRAVKEYLATLHGGHFTYFLKISNNQGT